MLPKKKSVPVKKNLLKLKSQKGISEQADTINTTKQKTFATIEQIFQTQDHKTSTRTTHYTSRRECIDRMQANKLSPFSSPGQSLSPKHERSFSPAVVKQKEIKKKKKDQPTQPTDIHKKVGNNQNRTAKASKKRPKNQQKARAAFQNKFLKILQGLDKKRITQVSGQMEDSIRKSRIRLPLPKKQIPVKMKKDKKQITRQMHNKIKQKYRKQYPNLKQSELKILCAIVLIQRLWRQKKVKLMIGEFLSPRNLTFNSNYFANLKLKPTTSENQQLNSNLIIDESVNQQTMKTEKSFPSLSPRSIKAKQQEIKNVQELSSIEERSQILVTPQKSSINLKDLQLSDDLSAVSSTKAKQNLSYINMYREVTLNLNLKQDKKKKKQSKPNTFNFPESLSEKCLLQNLYKKRISNLKSLKPKIDKDDLFIYNPSIQRIKWQYISPKKPQIVLQERLYTEAQDQQFPNTIAKQQKQPIKLQDQTVKSISNVGIQIVQFLISEFQEQFKAFRLKKCLKKKKRLPGIVVNEESIQTYLNEFIKYIRNQYEKHLENSFSKISGNSFLKFLRVPFEQGLFQQGEESQDQQELNFPVLPPKAFFDFQFIYEEKIFQIKEEDHKFVNFLTSLIKIHNKCLADSFSDFIEKQRLESISFPWDELGPAKSQKKIEEEAREKIPQKINEITKRILQISNTRLGRLHKKDYDQQQTNLLKSLKQEYKREGKDWSDHQQLLQVRLQLSELVSQQLIEEITQQLSGLCLA